MKYNNIPWGTSTKTAGPPTNDFDAAAADYAQQTIDVEGAPTRIAAPAAPTKPAPSASVKQPRFSFPFRPVADVVFCGLLWGFLRLLRLQLQPAQVGPINLLLSPVAVALLALLATAIAAILETKLSAKLKAAQRDAVDEMPVSADSLRSIRHRLANLSRLRNLSTIAMATYILTGAI